MEKLDVNEIEIAKRGCLCISYMYCLCLYSESMQFFLRFTENTGERAVSFSYGTDSKRFANVLAFRPMYYILFCFVTSIACVPTAVVAAAVVGCCCCFRYILDFIETIACAGRLVAQSVLMFSQRKEFFNPAFVFLFSTYTVLRAKNEVLCCVLYEVTSGGSGATE